VSDMFVLIVVTKVFSHCCVITLWICVYWWYVCKTNHFDSDMLHSVRVCLWQYPLAVINVLLSAHRVIFVESL